MSASKDSYLKHCLYFTANSLARSISRLADEEFGKLGIGTTQAFLLMICIEEPGLTVQELAGQLNLAHSTVSRFVDALAGRGLLQKQTTGKYTHVHPTENGRQMLEQIHAAWTALFERYTTLLGKDEAIQLTKLARAAHRTLDAG